MDGIPGRMLFWIFGLGGYHKPSSRVFYLPLECGIAQRVEFPYLRWNISARHRRTILSCDVIATKSSSRHAPFRPDKTKPNKPMYATPTASAKYDASSYPHAIQRDPIRMVNCIIAKPAVYTGRFSIKVFRNLGFRTPNPKVAPRMLAAKSPDVGGNTGRNLHQVVQKTFTSE